MTLGEILKEARKAKGMTIKDLEGKTDISSVSIGNYERGKRCPRVTQLHILCEVLDLDFNEMYNIAYPN